MDEDPSVVEYFAEHEGYRCGYCKSKDSNFSHGMWAHQMHVQDYQDLIDRGWRRSGKYCYKPTMNRTCCPMYTIRCDAVNFKMSKSQRKVLKRVNRYLITGKHDTAEESPTNVGADSSMSGEGDVKNMESMLASKVDPTPVQPPSASVKSPSTPVQPPSSLPSSNQSEQAMSSPEVRSKETKPSAIPPNSKTADSASSQISSSKQPPKQGSGPDPNKPACRKAKELRAEKRQQKLAFNPDKATKPTAVQKNAQKSLEDLLSEPDNVKGAAHKLEMSLCRSAPQSQLFQSRLAESHDVFRSYQMTIHKDTPEECDQRAFEGFLVDSPLQELHRDGGPSMGYGSFHQQYILDGQIIAVGVIDILPHSVSSVYLYYDPAFSFLTLGVYSALREIAFVRELSRSTPDLRYYYMGFYIQSCPKMRYKGQYFPSFLACPETYNFIPIETCRPKLEESKYSRLDQDGAEDKDKVEDTSQVLVLHQRKAMPYALFTTVTRGKKSDQAEVLEYAGFVGKPCAYRMLLVRS